MSSIKLSDVEAIIGYSFRQPSLLKAALTHSAGHQLVRPFERLEFLGDRVLGLVIADLLYQKFPKEKEGDLAKRSAALVSRETCSKVADKLTLQDFIISVADDVLAGHSAIVSDAVEALIGALYLDGGLAACEGFIHKFWHDFLSMDLSPPKDAKSALQEWAQRKGKSVPVYHVLEITGPDHAPFFRVAVAVDDLPQTLGDGPTKRIAEQKAAQELLNLIQEVT